MILLAAESNDIVGGVLLAAFGGLLGWLATLVTNRASGERDFQNKFRLEKEYGRYCEIWEKLFELRKSLASSIKPQLGGPGYITTEQNLPDNYNIYQQLVRYGEPFISETVFKPARDISRKTLRVLHNIDLLAQIKMQLGDCTGPQATALIDENKKYLKEIDQLFDDVNLAIRKRVTPIPKQSFLKLPGH